MRWSTIAAVLALLAFFPVFSSAVWCPVGYYPDSLNVTARLTSDNNRLMLPSLALAPASAPQPNQPFVAWVKFPDAYMVRKWDAAAWRWVTAAGDSSPGFGAYGLNVTNDTTAPDAYTITNLQEITDWPAYNFTQLDLKVDSSGIAHVAGIIDFGYNTELFYARWNPAKSAWTSANGTPVNESILESLVTNFMPQSNSTYPALALYETGGQVVPKIAWVEGWNYPATAAGLFYWGESAVYFRQWDASANGGSGAWEDIKGQQGITPALDVSKTWIIHGEDGDGVIEYSTISPAIALKSDGRPVIAWKEGTCNGNPPNPDPDACSYSKEIMLRQPCIAPNPNDWCDLANNENLGPATNVSKHASAGDDKPHDAYDVRIAIDPSDGVHVAWGTFRFVLSPEEDCPFDPFGVPQQCTRMSKVFYRKWASSVGEWVDASGSSSPNSYSLNVSGPTKYRGNLLGIQLRDVGGGVYRPAIAFNGCDSSRAPCWNPGSIEPFAATYYREWNGTNWTSIDNHVVFNASSNVSNMSVSGWPAGGGGMVFDSNQNPYVAYAWDNRSMPGEQTQVQLKRWVPGDSCQMLSRILIEPYYVDWPFQELRISTPNAVSYVAKCMTETGGSPEIEVPCPPLYWSTNVTDASIDQNGDFIVNTAFTSVGVVNVSFYSYAGPYGPADVPVYVNSSWVNVSILVVIIPPQVDAGGPYYGILGQNISINGTAADSDGTVATIYWDNSSSDCLLLGYENYTGIPGAFEAFASANLSCASHGPKTIRLFAVDDAGAVGLDVPEVRVQGGIAANYSYLKCPLLTMTESTAVTYECIFQGVPCNPADITTNAVPAGSSGWVFNYNVFTLAEGEYTVTVTHTRLGASSCVINRISAEPVTVPDFGLFLLPLVAAAAMLLARKRRK